MAVPAPSPPRAPLQIVGLCGQTVEVVISGTVVSFTCRLPTAAPSPPGDIFTPGPTEPPWFATIVNAEDFHAGLVTELDQLNLEADPVVVSVKAGDEVSVSDLGDAFASAREQNRAVRLDIE